MTNAFPLDTHKCDQSHRIYALETKQEKMLAELADGRVSFAELRKDIHAATKAIEEVVAQLKESRAQNIPDKIRDALIFWLVPLVGSGVLWAILQAKDSGL